MRLVPAIATLLLGATSIAGTIDPNVPDQRYVEYGKKFKSVARIMCFDGESTVNLYTASCVIVSKTHVLTAAHVVANSKNWVVIADDGSQHKIVAMSLHPSFSSSARGRHDLAVGRTEEEFSLDEFPSLYEQTDEMRRVSSMAGFGLHGTFETGQREHDGKRRAGTNTIDAVDDGDTLVCSASRDGMTDLEFLIASGDSGGGLFIGDSLAGIHSCVMAVRRRPNSSWGEESGHTRISSCLDWIRKEMDCNGK
jgi:hypothetical protein